MYWNSLDDSPPTINPTANIETATPRIVEQVENEIYFYSKVGKSQILQLVKTVRMLDRNNLSMHFLRQTKQPDPIYVHINSFGGSLIDAVAGMEALLNCESELTTIVEGMAASAATFLSVVGNRRKIYPHSTMMIHQLSAMFWGTYSEFKDEKKNLDLLMNIVKGIYKKYASIPSKKIDEILKHDLIFSPEQCLKYGLVDEIVKNGK